MQKSGKKLILPAIAAILIAAVSALLFTAGAFSLSQKSYFDRNEYRTQLSRIYQEYNTESAYSDYKSGNKFAFARLLVNGYNGRDYGAVMTAFDEENGFAVLQFETPEAAKTACAEIESDGMTVDAEGTAQLCEGEKGMLYPEGSNALGTPQYISKYRMGSENVVVAIIDTGVMFDHEELVGRFVSEGYDYSEDGAANAYFDTEKSGDVYGHATFIAGIIADNTPDTVKILPYKVVPFGRNIATASSMISAVNDAVSSGATVINISITSSSSGTSFRNAIKNAKEHGVCVCAAAGNQAKEIKNLYPAGIDETITVSALENDFETFAEFSNYGQYVDFCATGRKIVSLAPYTSATDSRHRKNSGTSFSSPYIASLCADIKTINNSIPVDDVCSVLADFCIDLGDKGRDDYYGWGMPNVSDITYTDNESYIFSIPEGTLSVYGTKDYTAETQPWRLFADRLMSVDVAGGVERIGDYNFYNVKSATFTMNETYDKIGDYAFYSCANVKEINFTIDCSEVGAGAFGGIENFVINGYRNTAAEVYALSENITFNALGCRHNYLSEVVDPTSTQEGYTHYTCSVCGDEYDGPYIEPILIYGGTCGENLTYSFYDTGKLTVSGEGEMYDYLKNSAPWSSFAESIKILEISGSTVQINPFAFYGCTGLAKIRCDENDYYTVSDGVLYSADMSVLVLLPKIGGRAYKMPDSVTSFDASALVLGTSAVEYNSNFTLINSIVYDRNGNIICALPSYKDTELLLSFDISVSDFAFILTEYPHTVRADSPAIEFGKYSFGYYFDGTLHKQDITFKTYDSGTGRTYAEDNGFTLKTYNRGTCGEYAEWYYDTQTLTLTLSGSGSMYAYNSVDEIPWKDYMAQITSVIIGDEITSLSEFAFYNAVGIKSLTIPASLAAAKTSTTWYGCTGIQTLKITFGSGYMDDYGDCYKFSPWYISRKSIGRFELDKNVLYIGCQAFRGCSAIKEVTLEKCEEIAADAFLACTKLDKFTLTSKECVINDYSLFAYKTITYGIYASPVMYGYDDSTAKDYCTKFGANFVSLGCGHSRSFILISKEIHECCFDNKYHYFCNDCGSEYDMFEHTTDGHYVTGRLHTLEGVSIKGADVYIDGKLSAITNAFGGFVCENVICGTHTVQFKKEGSTFFTAELAVDKSNVSEELQIPYGDYNADGFINGRDLALAKAENIADKSAFDWGTSAAQNTVFDTKSDDVSTPFAKNCRFEAVQGSDYRKYFYASIVNNGEYTLDASGFLYGVEMDEDDLVLENAGSTNENGKTVHISESVEFNAETKVLAYGVKSKKSWFGVRFYVVYSNGVNTHTYYSDVYKYSYE